MRALRGPSAWRGRVARRAAVWARRRQGEDPVPFSLERRRIYILPTRNGIGFAVVVLGALVAGLNYSNSLALLVAFLLGAFVIVAMNATHRNLLGLRISSVHVRPSFAGESACLEVELENRSRDLRCALRLAVAPVGAPAPVSAEPRRRLLERASARRMLRGAGATTESISDAAMQARLEAGARARLQLALPTQARGVFALERLKLESCYPFGLFRAWAWLHVPAEVVVFPRPLGAEPAPAAPGEREQGSASRVGGGDEWQDLRAFRDGDPPRQVAWKLYARELPLLVKTYAGPARASLHFHLGAVRRAAGIEAALSQIARWVVDAEARGARYRLSLPGVELPEGRGTQHQRRCLEALARTSP